MFDSRGIQRKREGETNLVALSKESDLALVHEHDVVKHLVEVLRGLKKRANDGDSGIGEDAERSDDVHGGRGIETGRGLVEKKDTGSLDEFNADTDALSLSSTDSTQQLSSDNGVCGVTQAEDIENDFNLLHETENRSEKSRD